jgi:hypothetical protein
VKFHTLNQFVLALLASFLLAACGGGGASTNNQGGPLFVAPDGATFYAGQPSTITITGGKGPYSVTSSEPGVLPVPSQVNGSFQVIPHNNGVVDAGLPPGSLPVRTVNVTVRDILNNADSVAIKVAQNFLTGYGFSFGASTCAANSPCAGGETALLFDTTFNGSLHGNEMFRVERVRGPFQFVDPLNSNNQTDTVTVGSDHTGTVTTVIRVAAGIPSQIGIVRLVHIATGASVEYNFQINGNPASGALTIIPSTVSFTGASDQFCGTGSADVYVFDGQAPYTATCPNPNTSVSPSTSSTQPGKFTFSATNNQVCLTDEACFITDATGARVIVPITTKKGEAAPAPTTLTVSPDTLTLACGASGSVTVVGGTGSYSANSSSPRVTATVAGNIVTIRRLTGDPAIPATQPTDVTVTITDGASLASVAVTITPDVIATGKCI